MPLAVIWFVATAVVWLPVFGLLVFIRENGWGGEAIVPASFLVALGFSSLFTINVAQERSIEEQRHQAIERGYALYCPHDGEFAWKGECEEDE